MNNFRQEVDGRACRPTRTLADAGLLAVPDRVHGAGPDQAIYQARFMKYLEARGFIRHGKQKVWCFLGDGECDEPESLGASPWPAARSSTT